MLKQENRLQKERDFGKVFKGSRPIHAENLSFRVAKRNHKSQIINHKQIPNSNLSVDSRLRGNDKTEKLKAKSYQLEASRFGFVISNKISKLATRRNALKRQLRTIIEQELPNIKTGFDVVIMVKLDFKYPYEQKAIKEQVEVGLKKMDLYNH